MPSSPEVFDIYCKIRLFKIVHKPKSPYHKQKTIADAFEIPSMDCFNVSDLTEKVFRTFGWPGYKLWEK